MQYNFKHEHYKDLVISKINNFTKWLRTDSQLHAFTLFVLAVFFLGGFSSSAGQLDCKVYLDIKKASVGDRVVDYKNCNDINSKITQKLTQK
jgi:hypothetical protein